MYKTELDDNRTSNNQLRQPHTKQGIAKASYIYNLDLNTLAGVVSLSHFLYRRQQWKVDTSTQNTIVIINIDISSSKTGGGGGR